MKVSKGCVKVKYDKEKDVFHITSDNPQGANLDQVIDGSLIGKINFLPLQLLALKMQKQTK